MTMLDSFRDIQLRSLEGMKSAQEQFISYNERIAETMLGATPNLQSPFAQYLPNPSEMVERYFEYVGEVYEVNKDFATRMAAAWDRDAEAKADA